MNGIVKHIEQSNGEFLINNNMTRDELLPIMIAMETYGGSFAKNLAKAMLCADRDNLKRIVEAFPELIERYKEFIVNQKRVRCIDIVGLGTLDEIKLGGEYTIKNHNINGGYYNLVEFGDDVWYSTDRFEEID